MSKKEPEIGAYLHCAKCLEELPETESPASFARLSVGWTRLGLQVWCSRHDLNVINLDFKGQKVGAI